MLKQKTDRHFPDYVLSEHLMWTVRKVISIILLDNTEKWSFSGTPKPGLVFLDLIWNWPKNSEKRSFSGTPKPVWCSWTWFETGSKTVKNDHFRVPETRSGVPGLDLKLIQKLKKSDHFRVPETLSGVPGLDLKLVQKQWKDRFFVIFVQNTKRL